MKLNFLDFNSSAETLPSSVISYFTIWVSSLFPAPVLMLIVTSGTWYSSGSVVLKMTWTSADILAFAYILFALNTLLFNINYITSTGPLASALIVFCDPLIRASSDRSDPSAAESSDMLWDYFSGMLLGLSPWFDHRLSSHDPRTSPWLTRPGGISLSDDCFSHDFARRRWCLRILPPGFSNFSDVDLGEGWMHFLCWSDSHDADFYARWKAACSRRDSLGGCWMNSGSGSYFRFNSTQLVIFRI